MPVLRDIVCAGVYMVMAVSVIAALGAVLLPNLFHAALALTVVLIGTAGVYLALQAEFMAMVQILIYVGAVMTLIVFAVMMTENIGKPAGPSQNGLALPAFGISLIFFMALAGLMGSTPWPVRAAAGAVQIGAFEIGRAFMTEYVFPFEVISVFLISALIGSVILAKKETP